MGLDSVTVYIGWDSRESIAAEVCKYSILKHATIPVDIVFLKQDELRLHNLYSREIDKLASTEFTFTRFLVPALNEYKGFAVFMDCDMLMLEDIAKLLKKVRKTNAVTCVQHDYTPEEGTKMDGQVQTVYPRKNWSSMVIWNCAHPANKLVTVDLVNDPETTGKYLHRFSWIKDKNIGSVGPEWNWLVGWYKETKKLKPNLIHYTEGGPWFEDYQDCEYSNIWNQYCEEYKESTKPTTVSLDNLGMSDLHKQVFKGICKELVDPSNLYNSEYSDSYDTIKKSFSKPNIYGIIDAGLDEENTMADKIKPPKKPDGILESFLHGSVGVFAGSKQLDDIPKDVPIAVRGIAKRKVIHKAIEDGRDFYYIDTGYFGHGKSKLYHRVSKNSLQYNHTIHKNIPTDRLKKTGIQIWPHTRGTNILLCPPSQKALNYWDVDLDTWILQTTQTIKRYTDRPIVIREKQSRHIRTNEDTMEMALSRDVHCLVTYNSIAAVEALIYGKPVFTMGPNAAAPLANTDLSKIESPYMPNKLKVKSLCANLAYNQFTPAELEDGTAWRILERNYRK